MTRSPDLLRPRKSRFRNAESPSIDSKRDIKTEDKSPESSPITDNFTAPQLSKEEMLQNLVRILIFNLSEISLN